MLKKPNLPSQESKSVLQRADAILAMFNPQQMFISPQEIGNSLGVSTATAYRYASDLCDIGLLAKTSGRYRLGPRILSLEYLIRFHDPVIQVAHDTMAELCEHTGHDVILSNIYEDKIFNVLHLKGRHSMPALTYTRGVSLPVFRGSSGHITLAYLDSRKLRRLFDRGLDSPNAADVQSIGSTWEDFSKKLKRIRKAGHYVSRGEIDGNVTGIAAPIFASGKIIIGSLVIVYETGQKPSEQEPALINQVMAAASRVSDLIYLLASPNVYGQTE